MSHRQTDVKHTGSQEERGLIFRLSPQNSTRTLAARSLREEGRGCEPRVHSRCGAGRASINDSLVISVPTWALSSSHMSLNLMEFGSGRCVQGVCWLISRCRYIEQFPK